VAEVVIMKTHIAAIIVAALLVGPVVQVSGHSRRAWSGSITDLMSPKEIEATGVNTLSAKQVAALTAWIDEYQWRIAQDVADITNEGYAGDSQSIETNIDGDFDGWDGATIFTLANGQVWQQASPSAKYLFAKSPRVMITRQPYKMRVEGIPVEIAVRRLK
jgi:hypothetical protein